MTTIILIKIKHPNVFKTRRTAVYIVRCSFVVLSFLNSKMICDLFFMSPRVYRLYYKIYDHVQPNIN